MAAQLAGRGAGSRPAPEPDAQGQTPPDADRARPATWPTPPTTPGWSRRSSAWPRRPDGPAGSPGRHRGRGCAVGAVRRQRVRCVAHERTRCRDPHRPAHRQPGRGRALGQLGGRRRPAAPGGAHRSARYQAQAEAVIAAMGRLSRPVPVAFTGLVAAADLADRGLTEVVVTGDRPDLVAVVQCSFPARRGTGVGGTVPVSPVGGSDRTGGGESGLRLPGLRLPGSRLRSRDPGVTTRSVDPLASARRGHPPLRGPRLATMNTRAR